MKMILQLLSIYFLLSMNVTSARAQPLDGDDPLQVSLDKGTYILHESIWLDVVFVNSSPDTVRTYGLRYPNHRGFNIYVSNNKGELLKYTGLHYDFVDAPRGVILRPGELDYGSFDLLWLFAFPHINSGSLVKDWRFPCIPLGRYTVQVEYEGHTSVEVSFEIILPSGEELSVLEDIRAATREVSIGNGPAGAMIFEHVSIVYPKSVFVEKCKYFSLEYSFETEDAHAHGDFVKRNRIISKEMLENFPDSGDSWMWLLAAIEGFDIEQGLSLIRELTEVYPNSRISKYGPQLRKSILSRKKGEE